MHRLRALGVVLSLVALAGYVAAIWIAFPGRAVTITVFMIGVTLVAIGGSA